MELLCLGDIALIEEDLSKQSWQYPIKITPEEEVRILFNWELPIGKKVNTTPRICGGPRLLSFPSSPEVIRLWAPGFVALATNHILDAEERGLIDTIASLNRIGFITTGAGLTQEEITKPLIWETKEGKLAIVNWVFPETNPDKMTIPGPNYWPGIGKAKEIILALKRLNDWVLVLAHWSDELFPFPRPEDREIVRELAYAGLDLFVGHHPHVVRGMEIINECPVFYSIGNYFFSNYSNYAGDRTSKWAPRNREALGIQFSFKQGDKPRFNALSFWQKDDHDIEDPKHRAINRMRDTSVPLNHFSGKEYENWYTKKRNLFDTYWAKWHFGIRRYGFVGSVRRILEKLHTITS